MELSSIHSLLVIKPSSLGDIVHTLPVVAHIKKRFPHLRIGWVVNETWAPVLEGNAALDRVIVYPRDRLRGWRGIGRAWRWARGLKTTPAPDLALDFQGLLRSALIGRFSGAACLMGLSDAREGSRFFYDTIVDVPRGGHAVDRYFSLAEAAGAPREPAEPAEFPLPPGRAPEGEWGARGALLPGFVLLHPYSRGRGKSFSPEMVVRFCEAVAPREIILVGMLDGEPPPKLPRNAVNLVNATGLPELIWLLRRTSYTVSVDSGPMHLAAALSDRVLGVHTWTDPRKVGPYGGGCLVWKSGTILRVRDLHAGAGDLCESRDRKVSSLEKADIELIAEAVRGEIGRLEDSR